MPCSFLRLYYLSAMPSETKQVALCGYYLMANDVMLVEKRKFLFGYQIETF